MARQVQIEDSKQRISDALFKLMQTSDFEAITLSEIAAHAGVTRMTLHRHFKTKENIILYNAKKTFNEELAKTKDSPTPLILFITKRLETLKRIPHRSILLKSPDLKVLLQKFQFESFSERLKQKLSNDYKDDPYFYHFYFGGMDAIVRAWLEDDCRIPTEKIVEKIVRLTRRFLDE